MRHSPEYFPTSSQTRLPPAADPRRRLKSTDVIVRAATVEILRRRSFGHDEPVEDAVRRIYQSCPATGAYIERAAVNPAMSGVAGWAAELVTSSNVGFLALVPRTVLAQLADQPGALILDGVGPLRIPSRSSPLTLVGNWVAEAAPKMVGALALVPNDLTAKKLSGILIFTEELMEKSVPSVEALCRNALEHDLGAMLDSTLLGSAAASSSAPAGIFNGATTVTASTDTIGADALYEDAGALVGAISADNPDALPVFIAPVAQASRLRAAGFPNVIGSNYVPAKTVGVVDASALVVLVNAPEFAASRNAVIHMDTVPGAISTPGAPNVVSAPTRSTFQTDSIALRATLRANWLLRRSNAAAQIASVGW